MGKKILFIIFLFLLVLLVNSWASDESYQLSPKFQIEKVIELSKQYAIKEGYDLSQYFIDSVKYEKSESKNEWIIHFQGHLLTPGNDFMIWLEEATEKMRLMRGE